MLCFIIMPLYKNLKHSLYNTGEEELHMMFVYAPGIVVDHWAKEQSGEIK